MPKSIFPMCEIHSPPFPEVLFSDVPFTSYSSLACSPFPLATTTIITETRNYFVVFCQFLLVICSSHRSEAILFFYFDLMSSALSLQVHQCLSPKTKFLLFQWYQLSIEYIDHNFSLQSSVDWHLSCFRIWLLSIVPLWTEEQKYLWELVFS